MTRHEERLLREHFGDGEKYGEAARRLRSGEPLAYILGEWYFWRYTFVVTPDVLVPQPDTEILVERAIKLLQNCGRLLDLCTGSGCIACSVLADRPDASGAAVDISEAAVEIARKNAFLLGLCERLSIVVGDVLSEDCPSGLSGETGCYDLIVSNPPYIRSGVIPTLSPQVRAEPHIALDGGESGLRFYEGIIAKYPALLTPSGRMLLEIGYDQAECVRELAVRAGLHCDIIRDYGGNDRVAELYRE